MQQYRLLIGFLLILCSSCSSSLLIDENNSERAKRTTTESDYYWYEGDKISLNISDEYIMVYGDPTSSYILRSSCLLDDNSTKSVSESDELLHKVRINDRRTKSNKHNTYYSLVDEIKKEGSGVKVFPVVVGSNGAQIGTSNYFYAKIDEKINLSKINQLADSTGIAIVSDVEYTPYWYIFAIENSIYDNAIQASNAFMETGMFDKVDPAFMFDFRTSTVVNDPLYYAQWGLNNSVNSEYDVNIENAWTISKGNNVNVAIIDSGIDSNHPDLSNNNSYLCYNTHTQGNTNTSNPTSDHGTHVAGIILASSNNGLDIAGVAPEAEFVNVYNSLMPTSSSSMELARGINYAWTHDADILNCSWGDQGGTFRDTLRSAILEEAIINAILHGRNNKGSIVVFAAGNYGSEMDYPGSFDERILTVGSIGQNGYPSSFSAYGNKLDVVAPGENIISTLPGSFTGYMSGTSMSAPFVSGIAALILKANPLLCGQEVVRIIEISSKKINSGNPYVYGFENNKYGGSWNQHYGYGLVDAARAVNYANTSSSFSLPSNGYSLSLYNEYGMPISIQSGYIYSNDLTGSRFYLEVPNVQNNSYSLFWQVMPYQSSPFIPIINALNGGNAIMELPDNMTSPSSFLIRCCIFDGNTFVAAPSFDLHINN